ncbi:MAG TPA: hypothetical protein VFW50_10265 [Streptosporangiaceae bacterium]|nr:hypothetical protein [Streptosporangiaceae bacterium]
MKSPTQNRARLHGPPCAAIATATAEKSRPARRAPVRRATSRP